MGGACGSHGEDERCITGFDGETWDKGIISKTYE